MDGVASMGDAFLPQASLPKNVYFHVGQLTSLPRKMQKPMMQPSTSLRWQRATFKMTDKQDAQLQTTDPGPSGSRGRRILIVDDNRDAADSLAMLLEMEGHEVRAAYCGQEALDLVKADFKPQLAILDIGLPDIGGYDLAGQLRQESGLQHATLVALTGWGQEEHKERARSAGFDHHLTKPVDPDHLSALIGAME